MTKKQIEAAVMESIKRLDECDFEPYSQQELDMVSDIFAATATELDDE